MEKGLGLQYLPPEIIVEIASYLDVQDIISCSTTCSLLRQSLNDDLVWKKLCSFEAIDYFKWGERKKYLEWEKYESSAFQLPKVCAWRQYFMMQACLWKNWKNSDYHTVEVEFGPESQFFDSTQVLFLENDHLFIHSWPVKEINTLDEIWNVQKYPFLHSSLNLNVNQYLGEQFDWLNSKSCKINVSDSKLVISLNRLVLIYDITLSSFSQIPLDYAFFFDGSDELDANTISESCTVVSSDFFIGAKTVLSFHDLQSQKLMLYLWNTKTGAKIKEEHIVTNSAIESFSFILSEDKKELIVKLRLKKDRYMYHYYGYNVSKLEQSQFTVKVNYCDFEILFGDNVIGVGVQRLFVYSYNSAAKVANLKTNQEILKKTIKIVDGYLLFGTFENIIYVLNPLNLKLVNKVKLGFTLYSLQPVCGKFVVINSNNCEVWQISKTAKKLFKLPCDTSFAAVNQYGTKLAALKGNKIKVLKFW